MSEAPEVQAPDNSVRGRLEAAFAADAAAAPEPVQIKPATIPEPASAPTPDATPVAEAPKEAARDDKGRFAPKAADAAPAEAKAAPEPQPTDKPAAPEPEAQGEPIRPPAALSAAAKAKWATLDPVLQAEWSKRERDMDQGRQKQAEQLKRYEGVEQVLAPVRAHLAVNGVTEADYIRNLSAADQELRGPNKLRALVQIAEGYNIDLRQLAQPGQQAQAPQGQPQPDPAQQQLASELASLKGELAQMRGAAVQTEQARIQAQIDSFAKDHPYFENVRPMMGALLNVGTLKELADSDPLAAMKLAYDQACRASDEVWPVLQQQEAAKQAEAARTAAAARANEARQAAGSVTGSPAPGAAPSQVGPPPSIRESLERQFSAAAL